MSTLAALEQQFLGHVRGDGEFPREWCAQGLVDSDIGLSIYANAYGARLREALEADHPILSVYLGDALWDALCIGYVAAHPSRVRSLRLFGASLPTWLAANAPYSTHPLIAELATFERSLMDAFDAADASRLEWSSFQALEATAWPELRLRFHPSVRAIESQTNAMEVWRALKDQQDPPPAGASAAPARLIWRDDERISRFRSLDAVEWTALRCALVEGVDFSKMCEQLSQILPAEKVPQTAIGLLRQWVDEGIIGDHTPTT